MTKERSQALTMLAWVGSQCGIVTRVEQNEGEDPLVPGDRDDCVLCPSDTCRAVVVEAGRPLWAVFLRAGYPPGFLEEGLDLDAVWNALPDRGAWNRTGAKVLEWAEAQAPLLLGLQPPPPSVEELVAEARNALQPLQGLVGLVDPEAMKVLEVMDTDWPGAVEDAQEGIRRVVKALDRILGGLTPRG